MIYKGVVSIFLQNEDITTEIDWLGKGSIFGQYSVFSEEESSFGAKSVCLSGTTCLMLDKEMIKVLRKRKDHIDSLFGKLKGKIDSAGIPKLDFAYYNEIYTESLLLDPSVV